MAKTNLPLALAGAVNETITSTSEKITRLSQGTNLEDMAIVREVHDVLKTTTQRVANLLNEGTPTHRLPPELLSRIVDLAVERNFYQYPRDVNSFTHVCRYWRTVVLSYPKIWSLLYLLPGNPVMAAEWLARGQKHPLTLFAEFTDVHDHPPCRYKDSAAADLDVPNEPAACSRHRAILSLDQLLPHRSRICDISLVLNLSDPSWDDDDKDALSTLLRHQFFKDGLPNLERLDFRARHEDMSAVPTPAALFAKDLPRLRELKYLGAYGGLIGTAKDLTSCEIGYWSRAAGPLIIDRGDLRTFFNNNKTLESLTINRCNFIGDGSQVPKTLMTDLKFLKADCPISKDLEIILSSIRTPQLEDLNTVDVVRSSLVQVIATNGSDHRFIFSLPHFLGQSDFQPLRHLGAEIITLRLGKEVTLRHAQDGPALCKLLNTLDAVQVLELDGATNRCVWNIPSPGMLPRLKVIQVAIDRAGIEGALGYILAILESCVLRGVRFTMIRPRSAVHTGALD